jgi:uncharacterized protein
MQWLNEPKIWTASDDRISLVTDENTDFWQSTFYGFEHDNGHCYLERVTGDFTAEVSFTAAYEQLYDQAGLMLRFSERSWLKAGVEYVGGRCTIGTVLTRGQSDWAIGPTVSKAEAVRLRLTRRGDAVCVQWAPVDPAVPYETLRLGPISSDAEAMIGPMACSPTRAGLAVAFTGFKLLPPIDFTHAV